MRTRLTATIACALLATFPAIARAEEEPAGKGMTEANQERLVLDDMEDVADWDNGSPDETVLSASGERVKQGKTALLFANTVDHTKGEKNYPVGWPRTGKALRRENLTDWSAYDFLECWIYARTSRAELPKTPLGVGFYHSGHKRSSHFPLGEVKKDAWVKVVIPVPKLLDPADVQRVQFNISESDYKHGDRVDFFIDDVVLTRYVEPALAEVSLEREIVYSGGRTLRAAYELVGYKDLERTKAELAVAPAGGPPVAQSTAPAARRGEIALTLDKPLAPGEYRALVGLRDAAGRLIDRKEAPFRVIRGPFD